MSILDDIYQAAEKKIRVKIMQTRINNMKGKQRAKTLAMERIQQIEDRITKQFEDDKELMKQMSVIQ